MRHHRFYANTHLKLDLTLELPKEASHHCVQVLRYQVGDSLILFNGDGFDYLAQIKQIQGKKCDVIINQKIELNNESALELHLYQGIARGEKMDFIIQKSVELGVKSITPLFTERCNVKLDQKRLEKKQQHWQKVAISASEQSGRATLVKINPAIQINQLKIASTESNFYLEPTAKVSISSLDDITQANIFIGPEGGFSDKDLQTFQHNHMTGITLSSRILRTETAGLACLASLQTLFGDF